jgi:hypothetical protein
MRICELTGCANERPVRIPFCSGHYNRLPEAIKRKLRMFRRSGQEYGMVMPSNQYLATVRVAHDWLLVKVEHKPLPGLWQGECVSDYRTLHRQGLCPRCARVLR